MSDQMFTTMEMSGNHAVRKTGMQAVMKAALVVWKK